MKNIGIIGAMPAELKDIQNAQKDPVRHEIAGYTFVESVHGSNRIITVCCGIGKVHAAMCTQVMIDKFGVDCIVNTGIAGGMKQGIRVLEIVVSTTVLPHDLNRHFLADYAPYQAEFEADPGLQALAGRVCDEMGIRNYAGKIVSGDCFITEGPVRDQIVSDHDPYAIDMESAAVGQCAWRNRVPFVSVRCISDLADEMASDEFEAKAAARVAEIVMKMCENE